MPSPVRLSDVQAIHHRGGSVENGRS